MNKLLKRFTLYAGIVLTFSIPVYYLAISKLWQHELDEHNITRTPEAGREDSFLIIGAITILTVFFFVLIIGGFIWLNRRISRRLWQPFYQTLEKMKAFDLSTHTIIKFDSGNIAEFEELNESINKLLESNIAIFRQQKEFTENASHELQTPLAIVQSKLDMLLQDEATTSSQSQIIEETNNALLRISRINKNLLLLAKIENQQFLEKHDVDLSDSLRDMLELLSGLFGKRTIEAQIESRPVVQGNRMLIEVMLTNLLMNALRHTYSESKIVMSLSESHLIVANSGSSPLESAKLFRRFSSASGQSPGSGLGLSIVEQICSRYGWTVEYEFIEQRHTFSVRF